MSDSEMTKTSFVSEILKMLRLSIRNVETLIPAAPKMVIQRQQCCLWWSDMAGTFQNVDIRVK